jgi:hypothetical protein
MSWPRPRETPRSPRCWPCMAVYGCSCVHAPAVGGAMFSSSPHARGLPPSCSQAAGPHASAGTGNTGDPAFLPTGEPRGSHDPDGLRAGDAGGVVLPACHAPPCWPDDVRRTRAAGKSIAAACSPPGASRRGPGELAGVSAIQVAVLQRCTRAGVACRRGQRSSCLCGVGTATVISKIVGSHQPATQRSPRHARDTQRRASCGHAHAARTLLSPAQGGPEARGVQHLSCAHESQRCGRSARRPEGNHDSMHATHRTCASPPGECARRRRRAAARSCAGAAQWHAASCTAPRSLRPNWEACPSPPAPACFGC